MREVDSVVACQMWPCFSRIKSGTFSTAILLGKLWQLLSLKEIVFHSLLCREEDRMFCYSPEEQPLLTESWPTSTHNLQSTVPCPDGFLLQQNVPFSSTTTVLQSEIWKETIISMLETIFLSNLHKVTLKCTRAQIHREGGEGALVRAHFLVNSCAIGLWILEYHQEGVNLYSWVSCSLHQFHSILHNKQTMMSSRNFPSLSPAAVPASLAAFGKDVFFLRGKRKTFSYLWSAQISTFGSQAQNVLSPNLL